MHIDQEETKALRDITEIYRIVKELSVLSESLDQSLFLPAINEIRDAFDHLMRVFAYKFNMVDNRTEDYVNLNLVRSKSHLLRAAYDQIDYINIIILKDIEDTLAPFSFETISAVFPEYYREIKPNISANYEEITRINAEKRVGINADKLSQHMEYVTKLEGFRNEVYKVLPALLEFEKTNNAITKHDKITFYAKYFYIAAACAVILAAGVFIIQTLFGR
ncbi:MAG TPA: hypothetical protein PLN41_01025 [Methanothrix sp.]|jgi:hypothetical protein|nr:hypothetical protein [Methanothrix sp.]HPY73485.1 hypothetical protein [Methanothrix sp.]